MQRILLCILIFLISSSAKADTIDNWQLYFNKKLITAYNQFSEKVIEKETVKLHTSKGFELLVNFHHCTMRNTSKRLIIQAAKGKKVLQKSFQKSYNTEMPLDLGEYLEKGILKRQTVYKLFYFEGDDDVFEKGILLASFILE